MQPQAQRPPTQLAPPTVIDHAFDDPSHIQALIEQGAPYKSIAAVQKEPENTRPAPWFRNFWALGGKVILEGADDAFHNPNFIEAAKRVFNAGEVEPLAMMTNLNPPAPAAPPHLDLPFFRGAHEREVPLWMLAPMGYSGLFQPWAIPVASVITWFYGGAGGAFEFWPQGADAPSRVVANLSANNAVIADNEYMYHRVREIGDPEDYLPGNRIAYDSTLALEGGHWVMHEGGKVLSSWPRDEVRVSILWKAFCFADKEEHASYQEGRDKLTPTQIVDIFQADLKARGKQISVEDLDGESVWAQTVMETYRPAMR